MFPNLWELDIHARHQQAHIASELRNCSAIDQSGLWSRDRLARLQGELANAAERLLSANPCICF